MIVLGIDPGSHVTGYAFVERLPGGRRIRVLEFGILKAKRTDTYFDRLGTLLGQMEPLLSQYQPEMIAMEQCFVKDNIRTALVLGQTRGAFMGLGWKFQARLREYPPTVIKRIVTGKGSASKEQVALMLKEHLSLLEIPAPLDASDALAMAWVGCQEEEMSIRYPQLLGT